MVDICCTVFSCCFEAVNDCLPARLFIQFIAFIISTVLGVLDISTDWWVVCNFRDNGFSNPLLPRNDAWLTAWLTFAGIGTCLTVVSILHEFISLVHTYCCTSEADKDKDPFSCCFTRGWNAATRNETLGALTLWFQELPMLVIGVLFVYTQFNCKSPQLKNVSADFLEVGISLTVAYAAIIWRFMRSIIRMCIRNSVEKEDVEMKEKTVIYPDKTCASNYCRRLFKLGVLLEGLAVVSTPFVVAYVWVDYTQVLGRNTFNDSLAIYRYGHPLFDISGNVIPPNGTFLHIENITELSNSQRDIYCLRWFEYHPEAFQIYFNSVDLFAVSNNADFCAAVDTSMEERNFRCFNTLLYYAYRNLSSDDFRTILGERCIVDQSPQFNSTIVNVYHHLGRTYHISERGEPVAVLYPDLNRFFLMGDVKSAPNGRFQGIFDPSVFTNGFDSISCVIELQYLQLPTTGRGQIQYNYRDVLHYGENNCTFSSTNFCSLVHTDLVYGYLSDEYSLVQSARCSNVPDNQLRPVYDPSMFVRSPC